MLNGIAAASRWLEIDLDAIEHNTKTIRRQLEPGTRLMAVVKADAYGHGSVEVAHAALDGGADMLGVTSAVEGIELRLGGIRSPVLVFGPLLPEEASLVFDYSLTPSVGGLALAEALREYAQKQRLTLKVHLKIETGLGRSGISPSEAVQVARLLTETGLEIEGVYTHFAVPHNRTYTEQQFQQLLTAVENLREAGINPLLKHACASSAFLQEQRWHLDLVRIGTLLYGQLPAGSQTDLDLKNAMCLKARVNFLRDLPAGAPVGYGGTWKAKRPARVAMIPVGFVDGFTNEPVSRPAGLRDLFRRLVKVLALYLGWSPPAWRVSINGSTVPVIGKVGMQNSFVDITGIPGVELGDEVILDIRRTSASARLPKFYLKDEQAYKVFGPVRNVALTNDYAAAIKKGVNTDEV